MGRMIFVTGSFDLLHEGHIYLFESARKIVGDDGYVIAAINSDKFFEQYKGFKPSQNEQDRLATIKTLPVVDEAFIVTEFEQQKDILDAHRPDFIIHGSDWIGESLYKNFGVDAAWLHRRGIQFVYIDRIGDFSSTNKRKELE